MKAALPPGAVRALAIGALVALSGVAAWQTSPEEPSPATARQSEPIRIMGTSCRLVAIARPGGSGAAAERATRQALAAAEAELRRVEVEMSTWIEATPVSHLNQAPAGTLVPLPPGVIEVLRASRDFHEATRGAFDITCGPLIELWRAAGLSGKMPTPTAIQTARAASRWDALDLADHGATKRNAEVRVDLGGVAKGYGIDQAIAAMRTAGVAGGLVDVGGDVRVFGNQAGQDRWEVQLRDPGGRGIAGTLAVRAGAVCTSGDYFRFVEIDGQRFSHIVDPRSGRPAAGVRSATVVAPRAIVADAWATALSVLGEAGLAELPDGVEGLLLVGEKGSLRAVGTDGFRALLVRPLTYPATFR